MIVESVFNMLFGLVKALFSWVNLPDMPSSVQGFLEFIKTTIINSCRIIGCFCTPSYLWLCITFMIAIFNFERLYHFTMFVLKKIPFLGIE